MSAKTKIARTHDDVLEAIAQGIDITDAQHEDAVTSYQSLGEWLDRSDSSLAAYDPEISPQGSFVLGTVTRPLTDAEEIDVDVVCVLKATKADFTQKTLKDAVGREIKLYAAARSMVKKPGEKRRCWTLHYADGAQFHMDTLPAIPDVHRYQVILEKRGYRDLARDAELTATAIAITDNTHPKYAVQNDEWPQSNPRGYALWFRRRMIIRLTELKKAYLGRGETLAKIVEDIPDYKVKTPLQQTIQLLKRHRDCMFIGDCEHKPISIIITTLAALAYNEEATISEALQSILTKMANFIEYRGEVAWVVNPVNPAENFADRWAENPKKRENFYKWLDQARKDFALYLRASQFDAMPDALKQRLGNTLVEQTMNAIIPASGAGIVAPAVVKAAPGHDMQRAERAIEEIRQKGTQSKPWAKR